MWIGLGQRKKCLHFRKIKIVFWIQKPQNPYLGSPGEGMRSMSSFQFVLHQILVVFYKSILHVVIICVYHNKYWDKMYLDKISMDKMYHDFKCCVDFFPEKVNLGTYYFYVCGY